MAAHSEYQDRLLCKTIPPDLHRIGYEGIAAAVIYQCLLDIVQGTYDRLNRAAGLDPKPSPNYTTAMKFMEREENPLYILEIPGAELAEKFIRRAEDDWKRKHKQGKLSG